MGGENFKDLTGQKFQYLTVIERTENYVGSDGKIKVRWRCLCDCGKETIKYSRALKLTDKAVSCGCMAKKQESKYNLEGQTVGFLKVIEKSTNKGRNRGFLWLCVCECGTEVFIETAMLVNNEKKSCGCKTKAETSGTHGMYGTPTYVSWNSMRERCTKEYHKSFERYKDKEIDPEWLESFEAFYKDMGERPEGMTLDRINNELGYNKENCRWATLSQQQQNKTPNKINKNKGLAGVYGSNGRFCARIRYNGQREYLGIFNTPEEANAAYNARGLQIFGDEWIIK